MRYLIRSRRGRAHLAYQAGAQWVGICGSLITHTTAQEQAVSASLLPAIDGVCFYCLAIGSEAAHVERRALEAVEDAEQYGRQHRPGRFVPRTVGA